MPRRGAEVVLVGVDQRAVVDRSVLRLQQRARRRIEVGQLVVGVPLRRRELVAQAEVERSAVDDARQSSWM